MDSASKVAGLTKVIRTDSVVRVRLALLGRLDPEDGLWVLTRFSRVFVGVIVTPFVCNPYKD